jgi:hypothetical protein
MPDWRSQAARRAADALSVRRTLTLALFAFAALAPAAQAATGETRIIVGRDPGLTPSERADVRHDAGVDLLHTLRIPNTEVVTTDTPSASLAELRRDPDVRYAEIDRIRHAFTNDEYFGSQWALENTGSNLRDNDWYINGSPAPLSTPDADMNVPEAWAEGATGTGVQVAVVDTGIDRGHADLTGQYDTSLSRGFLGASSGTDTGYIDGDGHGTHVSGIIAALSENDEGISGIAPGAKLVELKALDDDGFGSDSAIAAAFAYAGDKGVPIVNASLGGPGESTTLTEAMAAHPNTLYIVAAGNGGDDGIGDDNDATDLWPCNAPVSNIVCVGASTAADVPAGFSNYGKANVDLFAPGEYIESAWLSSGYAMKSGTSMASPAVAASAALALSAAPTLTTEQLKRVVLASADRKAAFNCRSVIGGRADAAAAVQLAASPPASVTSDCTPSTDGTTVAPPATPTPAPRPTVTITPAPTPAPAASAPADRDGDGRIDVLDACPAEAAATRDGCPVPALRSLVVKVSKTKHRVQVRVRADRAAVVAMKIERRICSKGRCRWRKAVSDNANARRGRTTLSRKLSRGRYRVSVRLSSNAGRGKQVRKSFRV